MVYLALNRFREANAVYEPLAPRLPAYTSGWLNLGICRLEQGNTEGALQALNQARRQRPDQPLAWLWLHRAYKEKGLSREAELALAKARAINKTMADAFEQIGQAPTNAPAPARAAP